MHKQGADPKMVLSQVSDAPLENGVPKSISVLEYYRRYQKKAHSIHFPTVPKKENRLKIHKQGADQKMVLSPVSDAPLENGVPKSISVLEYYQRYQKKAHLIHFPTVPKKENRLKIHKQGADPKMVLSPVSDAQLENGVPKSISVLEYYQRYQKKAHLIHFPTVPKKENRL